MWQGGDGKTGRRAGGGSTVGQPRRAQGDARTAGAMSSGEAWIHADQATEHVRRRPSWNATADIRFGKWKMGPLASGLGGKEKIRACRTEARARDAGGAGGCGYLGMRVRDKLPFYQGGWGTRLQLPARGAEAMVLLRASKDEAGSPLKIAGSLILR